MTPTPPPVGTQRVMRLSPLRITLIYAAAGLLWIYTSDTVVGWLAGSVAQSTNVSIFKGFFYVLLTAAMLYGLIDRYTVALRRTAEALRQGERTQRTLARGRQVLLNELDHRVRNNLVSLHSLIALYEQTTPSVKDFAEAMRGKVLAMRTAHEAIAGAGWQALDLANLVQTLARLFIAPNRTLPACLVDGPPLSVVARQAGPLAMSLQELLANSRKHGALSVPTGQVRLAWRVLDQTPTQQHVEITWQETGGPPVRPPTHRGQGLNLIEGFARFELAGECRFDFDPSGLRCVLRCGLDLAEDSTVSSASADANGPG